MVFFKGFPTKVSKSKLLFPRSEKVVGVCFLSCIETQFEVYHCRQKTIFTPDLPDCLENAMTFFRKEDPEKNSWGTYYVKPHLSHFFVHNTIFGNTYMNGLIS